MGGARIFFVRAAAQAPAAAMPAAAPDEGEGAPQPRIVYRTAVASLLVQLAVFLVTSASFFVPLPAAEREGLEAIFALELTSQFVEMAWYTVVVCRYRTILTWTRYADWVVSTPLMLLSLALFFYHRRGRPVWDVGAAPALYASLALNWAMLAAGSPSSAARAARRARGGSRRSRAASSAWAPSSTRATAPAWALRRDRRGVGPLRRRGRAARRAGTSATTRSTSSRRTSTACLRLQRRAARAVRGGGGGRAGQKSARGGRAPHVRRAASPCARACAARTVSAIDSGMYSMHSGCVTAGAATSAARTARWWGPVPMRRWCVVSVVCVHRQLFGRPLLRDGRGALRPRVESAWRRRSLNAVVPSTRPPRPPRRRPRSLGGRRRRDGRRARGDGRGVALRRRRALQPRRVVVARGRRQYECARTVSAAAPASMHAVSEEVWSMAAWGSTPFCQCGGEKLAPRRPSYPPPRTLLHPLAPARAARRGAPRLPSLPSPSRRARALALTSRRRTRRGRRRPPEGRPPA